MQSKGDRSGDFFDAHVEHVRPVDAVDGIPGGASVAEADMARHLRIKVLQALDVRRSAEEELDHTCIVAIIMANNKVLLSNAGCGR